MVRLVEKTFQSQPNVAPVLAQEIALLGQRLKEILTQMCGQPTTSGLNEFDTLPRPPKNLLGRRDGLKPDYKRIWKEATIIYEHDNYGASARYSTNTIIFGEFFTKTEIETLTLKKVLLHEFLHLAVDMPREMHHGQINKIIKHNLGYPGDPNPLGTD